MIISFRNFAMKHICSRMISTSSAFKDRHFKLIIAGGGTSGACTAHNFVNKLAFDQIAVIEPSEFHYYQPLWTLVGAGVKSIAESCIPMHKALPNNVKWFKDNVVNFNPDQNSVTLKNGEKLTYDYLVVALGIELRYDLIPGALEALEKDNRVVSNYSRKTVEKTYPAYQSFTEGNALFSFPNTPVKCAGGPQKVMYLFEDFLTKKNIRERANIQYFTSLPSVFSVKKYSDKLSKICDNRNITVTTKSHLIEVDHINRIAKFENIDTKKTTSIEYDFLHITPPMLAFDVIKSSQLGDQNGFVNVNRETLQHIKYENVFGIGDCSSLPTSKTAAAIAAQQNVLYINLSSLMNGGKADISKYNGYTSCPIVTGFNKGILAEFGYDGKILETFPLNQNKESRLVYAINSQVLPPLYWHGLIRGRWNGPSFIRKIFNFKNVNY